MDLTTFNATHAREITDWSVKEVSNNLIDVAMSHILETVRVQATLGRDRTSVPVRGPEFRDLTNKGIITLSPLGFDLLHKLRERGFTVAYGFEDLLYVHLWW